MMSIAYKIEDALTAINGESKDYFTETIAQGRF